MTSSSRPTSLFPPRTSAVYHHGPSQQQSSALATRVASKKAELENLKQLRDLSSDLAMRMQILEDRICTLKDGTEGSFSFSLLSLLLLLSVGRPNRSWCRVNQ